MSKTMGCSPITDTIYYGTVENDMWKGKRKVNMRKKKKRKKNLFDRTCEQCGNEMFSKRRVFKCIYCNWVNGIRKG